MVYLSVAVFVIFSSVIFLFKYCFGGIAFSFVYLIIHFWSTFAQTWFCNETIPHNTLNSHKSPQQNYPKNSKISSIYHQHSDSAITPTLPRSNVSAHVSGATDSRLSHSACTGGGISPKTIGDMARLPNYRTVYLSSPPPSQNCIPISYACEPYVLDLSQTRHACRCAPPRR